jgi:hypothetical protein
MSVHTIRKELVWFKSSRRLQDRIGGSSDATPGAAPGPQRLRPESESDGSSEVEQPGLQLAIIGDRAQHTDLESDQDRR